MATPSVVVQPSGHKRAAALVVPPLLVPAGLPPVRFLDLRHTAATLLLAADTRPRVVAECRASTISSEML
ncbi:MAG: hypothetical protein ACRDG6_09380 [Candidatus Limnocylindria bacterium]